MPELPEVETTVRELNRYVAGLKIAQVWSGYDSKFHVGKDNIKNKKYFLKNKKNIVGKTILGAERRAKNILINLSGGLTLLVHMKMTGHFLFGRFKKVKNEWLAVEPVELKDPFNRFIRFMIVLENGKHLAFSDMRKFAKITLLHTCDAHQSLHLSHLGPEPLEKFSFADFVARLMVKADGPIKQVLMNQEIIAGIGNIYSDEMLWFAGIHPQSKVTNVPKEKMKILFNAMKKILNKSIELGGDSASDFRRIDGKKGGFQNYHCAYRQTGQLCSKKRCAGKIERLIVGGRSAHFCNKHQQRY